MPFGISHDERNNIIYQKSIRRTTEQSPPHVSERLATIEREDEDAMHNKPRTTAQDEFTSSPDRETNYNMQSVLKS